ncbi:MAG TPA: hypothetical protein VKT32_04715, partial [Chthonomonadaceae bacterium]|nr:hypothetical protein [Chthonomonadaceae bacterium]
MSQEAADPMAAAEAAAAQLAKGDDAGAAHPARLALQRAPEEATFQALAGAILFRTGDFGGARTAFANAIACSPQDSLALYGHGLIQLASGDRQAALASFRLSGQRGGDRSVLLLAQNYAQWLGRGRTAAMGGTGLPASLLAAQCALEGMTTLQQGDPQRALNELK